MGSHEHRTVVRSVKYRSQALHASLIPPHSTGSHGSSEGGKDHVERVTRARITKTLEHSSEGLRRSSAGSCESAGSGIASAGRGSRSEGGPAIATAASTIPSRRSVGRKSLPGTVSTSSTNANRVVKNGIRPNSKADVKRWGPSRYFNQPRVSQRMIRGKTDKSTCSSKPSESSMTLDGDENAPSPRVDPTLTAATESQTSNRRQSTSTNTIIPEINGHHFKDVIEIGKGGYGNVYRAYDKLLTRQVAVKVVWRTHGGEQTMSNIAREIAIMQKLKGIPQAAQLLASQICHDRVVMVMELGQGDFSQLLQSRRASKVSFDVDFVRYWGGQILKCVAAIHNLNIVHSDLKPANFLVIEGGLKLIDFGISDELPEHTIGLHRITQFGTACYMAPETLKPAPVQTHISTLDYKVTKTSDVWSCGVMLYEMIYGQRPFQAKSTVELVALLTQPNVEVAHPTVGVGDVPVPLGLHEVVKGCLDANPATRLTASSAACSLFFCPKSVDLSFIEELMTNCIQYGRQHPEETSPNIKRYIGKAWERVEILNGGKP